MQQRASFLLIPVMFLCYSLHASDTSNVIKNLPTIVRFFNIAEIFSSSPAGMIPDSGLSGIHEVSLAEKLNFNTLGLSGSAANPMHYKTDSDVYSKPGTRVYDIYLWNPDSLVFFRGNKRFSQIDYHLGSFREQELKFRHMQNILSNWSAGIDFHRLGIRDYTVNSDVFHNQFAGYTWYESPNKKYNLTASAIWNAVKNEVNGGLRSDSIYESADLSNLNIKGLGQNLRNADQRLRNHHFNIGQAYRLTKAILSEDSIQAGLSFIHKSNFESGSVIYTDENADSSYYQNFFKGENSYDSIHYYDFRNRFGIRYSPKLNSSIQVHAGMHAEHQWLQSYTLVTENRFNFSLKPELILSIPGTGFGLDFSGTYVITGRDKEKYYAKAQITQTAGLEGIVTAAASILNKNPDLIYSEVNSNHFIWKNDLESFSERKFSAGYQNTRYKFSVSGKAIFIENLVKLDRNLQPHQFAGINEIIILEGVKKFSHKKIHFENRVIFQHTGRKEIIPLPEWTLKHSIYFQDKLFKNAMQFQAGVSLRYHSAYFSEAYMPALALFYLQQDQSSGGAALLDLHVNAKIRTARIFFRMENLLDGVTHQFYYLTPDYPQPGRTFKFGIVWRFFDQ
ncbi:MAG: hypothetical protein DWQ44_07895 [Bacteroidetes bacterium]|nr:MAG: hypothetical protein DWQ33_06905 [Bacteroidota bacterium]REJ99686.1 MAG: hypothetical protein DWQ39_12195 [Bacteroidota bacterium]REK33919.1 MAG: hypothetical protein DWQ44_07895 [Bacteroidota bacterium]REK47684.1 MAG: hypothetical protein DWQ48_11930 [Bacteroidota bacterium]